MEKNTFNNVIKTQKQNNPEYKTTSIPLYFAKFIFTVILRHCNNPSLDRMN